jgi:YVTN family beta-propeller protein
MAAPLGAQTVVGTISRSGMKPSAVAVYETGDKVFIADQTTGNLYIYDGTTLADLGFIYVGTVGRMVVDETYGKLYATVGTALTDAKVVAVNAATGVSLGEVVPYGSTTYLLAHDPGLAKVYTVNFGSLYQIDVATDTTASVALDSASYAAGDLKVNPVTHEVFIGPMTWDVALQVVDGVTMAKSTAPIIGAFCGLGVNWTENKVYRADCSGGPYTFLDRDTGVVSSIAANNDATTFAFNSSSNRLYTSSEVDGFLTIIEGSTDAFLNLGMFVATTGLGFRLSTNHVYYAGSTFIAVLDDTTQLIEMIPIGNLPPGGLLIQEVAVNQTTGRVFVINDGNALNFVTVVQDTEVPTRPPVFLASKSSSTAHALDPVSNQVVYSWTAWPMQALAVRPGGGRLYVPTGTVLKTYAGSTNAGSRMLQGSVGTGGSDATVAAVMPDGSRIYVTNSSSNNVGVIDTATNSLLTTVSVGGMPWGAAMTPDGSKVYVANRLDNTVSVIATASDTVVDTITVGATPWGVASNPAGTKVYVANSGANTVSVIGTASDTVIATVNVGTTPHWLAVTPDGTQVYVSNKAAGTVSVLDTGTDTVIHTVTVGSNPEGIGVLPDGTEVYVVNSNLSAASSLSVIDPSSFAVTTVTLPSSSHETIGVAVADPTSRFAGRINATGCPALVRALQSGVEKGRATTNQAGDYAIFNLKPGTYDLEASAAGFVTQTLAGQAVARGRTTIANFTLVQDTHPVPAISSLSPLSTATGGPGFNLTVNGSDFFLGSVVRWNGSDRPSQIAACGPLSRLTASIPASDITAPGTVEVTVFTPGPGGGLSNGLTFYVTSQFLNATSIDIADGGSPPTEAVPYPSNITVSGLSGTVSKIYVKLNGFSHTFPADVDILLVAPNGANAIIMSDVGGGTAVTGVDLVLDDAAASPLPDAGPLVSGTFQPTNIGAGDTFSSPAPTPSGGSALSAFSGIDPNGTWSLYVVDDTATHSGSLAGGWTLIIAGPGPAKKRKGQLTSE